jgi:hypothetical protein
VRRKTRIQVKFANYFPLIFLVALKVEGLLFLLSDNEYAFRRMRDRFSQLVHYLKANKIDGPQEMIINKLKKNPNRIIMLGSQHQSFQADKMDAMLIKLIPRLKEARLITYIALELPISEQEAVNKYLATGEKSDYFENINPYFSSSYIKILEVAKTNGLKIICIDPGRLDARGTDIFHGEMAAPIKKVLKDKEVKILIYSGNRHVAKTALGKQLKDTDREIYSIFQTELPDIYGEIGITKLTAFA